MALKEKKQFSYYDFRKLLSYNATYNFLVGARGLGKTYGAKKRVIKAYLRNGEQFIYLRRFKTELATRQTFFDDIANEFPDIEFRVQGSEAQLKRGPDWETFGYFAALSNAQTRKSVAYPKVTVIIFDEFIIERGALHYLPEEAVVFNNFYSTVDRWQDKTKVFFLANSVSIMNPYFLAYDIKPVSEFVASHEGFILAHFADSNDFANEVMQTKFGKFIRGTEYEEYAVNSVFADNHEYLIARKNAEAGYHFTLQTKGGYFSIWVDNKVSPANYYVQEDRPKHEIIMVTEPDLMAENKILIGYSDKLLQYLRAAYGRGNVLFDSPRTRNSFVMIFKR